MFPNSQKAGVLEIIMFGNIKEGSLFLEAPICEEDPIGPKPKTPNPQS